MPCAFPAPQYEHCVLQLCITKWGVRLRLACTGLHRSVLPCTAPALQYEDGVLELRIKKRAAEQTKAEGRTIQIA